MPKHWKNEPKFSPPGLLLCLLCKKKREGSSLLIHHFLLFRIAEHYEDNKMSPGNLGIVFGPTLLRPLVSGDVSMIALLETSYQALLVEFMISHYDHVFGPATRSSTPPPPPPTAPLPDTPPRTSCPLSPANSSSQDPEAAGRERPRSLEVGNKYLTSHNRRPCFKLAVVMTMLKAHLRWTCPCGQKSSS